MLLIYLCCISSFPLNQQTATHWSQHRFSQTCKSKVRIQRGLTKNTFFTLDFACFESAKYHLLFTCTNYLILTIIEFYSKNHRFRALTVSNQSLFSYIIHGYLMLIIHRRCRNKSTTFRNSDITDIPLKFFGKNSFSLKSVSIPNNKTRPSSHLPSSYNTFRNVDIKASNIIIMWGINSHGIFNFIKNNSTCGSMINNFSLWIISNVISSIIASISIDIIYLQIHIRCFILSSLLPRTHLITYFSPCISRLELISLLLNCLKLIPFIFYLMIQHFLFNLFWRLFRKTQTLHPQFTMKIILQHWFKLFKTNTFIMIVIILLEFTYPNIRREIIFNLIKRFQISINSWKKLSKWLLIHLSSRRIYFKN